jgi:hypothetical protein
VDAALTLAVGLAAEERAARKGGARVARVGLGAAKALPDGRLASFGLAGALVEGLAPGTLLSARRIVDESGAVVWEGEPLAVPGAEPAVLCAVDRVVDRPGERAALAARTGAVAVDMESGALVQSGRFAGAVRAVADGPERPLGRLAEGARADGGVAWGAVMRAFATRPRTSLRAALAARTALVALERAAGSLGRDARG